MHYYNWNISDYSSHTSHLTEMEDLAYRRMLDWLYLHEIPLPKEVKEIARVIRMREHCECIANVLLEFFTEHSDGYTHKRFEKELDAYRAKSERAKKSAQARWSKNKGLTDANALQSDCERNANQETINNKQEPKNNSTSDQRSLSVVKKIPKKSKNLVLADFTKAGINQEIAEDFIQHRKNLKAPVTRTAMKAICTEANKANLPIETVLAEIQNRGWRGFKAEWLQENDRKCFAQINDEYQKEKAKERYATLLSATEEELSEWGLQ